MATYDTEAFRFPDRFPDGTDPVPGLTEVVDRMASERRYRSALDTILRFLRTNGESAEAFGWALPILGSMSRSPDPGIAEPLTIQQYRNPYFAPIATECARCGKYWYSGHVFNRPRTVVTNPFGIQCQACRYSLCRECFPAQDVSVDLVIGFGGCPEEGCSGELGVPVLPTGRPRGMPANRHTEKLEHVLVLWHGAPTSPEEISELLDIACTWQDFGGITVRSEKCSFHGDDSPRQPEGWAMVDVYESRGWVSPGAAGRTRIERIAMPGAGQRLLFITAAPDTGTASQLSGPVKYIASEKPSGDPQPRKRRWFRRDS